MNQFALGFMALRLFVRAGSPWKNRGCKCFGEQISGERVLSYGRCTRRLLIEGHPCQPRNPGEASQVCIEVLSEGSMAKEARPAQRSRPGHTPAASPGQAMYPPGLSGDGEGGRRAGRAPAAAMSIGYSR